MDIFTIITKWFWVAFIAVTFANGAAIWWRAQREIRKHPELEEGYRTIIKGFLFWGNIPWIVMGIGHLVGGVPTIFQFFRPRDGNPFVLAFFASVLLIWLLGTHWLFFRGGAEMLVEHPGIFRYKITSPLYVKVYWLLCLAGGIVGVVFMFMMDVPVPTR